MAEGMVPAPVRIRPPPRVVAWTATLAVVAVVAAGLATRLPKRSAMPSPAAVVLLGLALFIAGRLNVDFRHHGEVDSLDLFESALTPAVFLLPAPTAVLLAALAKVLSQLWLRKPAIKIAFNAAQWAAATGAASLVFAALRPAADPPASLPVLAALAVGMLCASAVNVTALGVLFRILRTARPAGPSMLRPRYLSRTSAISAVNVATGMLIVLATRTAPAAVVLVLGPLLLLYLAGRGYTLAHTDNERLAALQRATHALAAPTDPRDGIAGYLAEVVRGFDARAADLVLLDPAQPDVDVHRALAPAAAVGAGSQRWNANAGEAALYRALLQRPRPSRLVGHQGGADADLLRAAGWRDCLAVRLFVEGDVAALLCVYDRSGSADVEGSDLLILQALGREMAAALHRAHLLDAVLDERAKLARIVNGSTDGILAMAPDGTVLTWNPALAALTGYPEAEMVGARGLDRLDPRDVAGAPVALEQWPTERGAPTDVLVRTASGEQRWLSCSYAEDTDPDRPALLILLARDVTEVRRQESLLVAEAHVLQVIAGNASLEASLEAVAAMIRAESGAACAGIFLAAGAGPPQLAAPAALSGRLTAQLLAGMATVTEQQWVEATRTMNPVVIAEHGRHGPHGPGAGAMPDLSCCWALPVQPDNDGPRVGVLTAGFAAAHALTDTDRALLRTASRLTTIALDRHEARLELTHQASHDPLTGLPNRSLFLAHCTSALKRAERAKDLVVVMFLDLDRFKFVNDSLGHDAGDAVLIAVADRLRAVVRPTDTVARFGGDEFTILCEHIPDVEQVRVVADRILQIFGDSFTVRGREVFESASIGIAVGRGRHLADELLENADAAMYRAKERGGNRYEFFDAAMRRAAELRLGTYVALRNAVDRRQFTVRYQPIMSLDEGGRLVGMEALVRWLHPTDGLLPPSGFISLAEETGLIVPIGAQVLHESLRQLQRWQPLMTSDRRLRMNVNVSGRQLTQPDLVPMIERALAETGTAATDLSIEITESVLVLETKPVNIAVNRLKGLGVGLSIDDFGTGHSSLTNLRRLPVTSLKVDRSFVAGLSAGREDAAIVSAVIQLGHDLGLTVVAEGIETAEELRCLQDLHCDEAQGYYFSAPLDTDGMTAVIRSGADLGGR